MTKIEITRVIVKGIVSTSVGFTVSRLLKANTPVTKTSHKIEVIIASFVIGQMIAVQAEHWTDKKFDKILEWFKPEDRAIPQK